MAHLEILVHRGCLSEQSVRTLISEIQHELPNWDIDIRLVEPEDADRIGHLVFPAILIDGQILTTGIPRKDWLLMKLREWDRKER
ncbi:hypothetical protein [Nitrospira sp. BLG_2]|uniref:hypothetical protein n=1 Tax=Nitrospira sp. BLG_2 TaxID=3397507 RepID=UPI003B99ED1C